MQPSVGCGSVCLHGTSPLHAVFALALSASCRVSQHSSVSGFLQSCACARHPCLHLHPRRIGSQPLWRLCIAMQALQATSCNLPLCCSAPHTRYRYARKHFPSTRYLDYGISVEEYTLQKVLGVCCCWWCGS
jgi:hypothetical protein